MIPSPPNSPLDPHTPPLTPHTPSLPSISITGGTEEGPEIDDQAALSGQVSHCGLCFLAAAGLRTPLAVPGPYPAPFGMVPHAGMNGELTSPSAAYASLHNMSPQMSAAAAAAAVVAYGRSPMVRIAGTEEGCGWGPAERQRLAAPTPADKDPVSSLLLLVHLHQRAASLS